VRLLVGALDEPIPNDGIEVHQGLGRRCDRDALPRGHVPRVQAADKVQPDSTALAPAGLRGDRDFHRPFPRRDELPVRGGGPVAEDRPGAAGQDSGDEPALRGEVPIAKGVHAAIEALELTGPDSLQDAVAAKPARSELLVRDHTELPCRNRRSSTIARCRSKRWRTFFG
jgi:hypothetical protein